MSKQDRQGARTPADVERKISGTISEVSKTAEDAQKRAENTEQEVERLKHKKITVDQLDIEGETLNVKVKAANITGKLTADQIDAKGLTVEAANITGTLKAEQIEGIKVSVNAADIKGKLSAEQIDTTGMTVQNAEGNFATYIQNGKISIVGTKITDDVGHYVDVPILRFKAFDGLYYLMCVRMTIEDPDTEFIGDETLIPSSIVFREDGYSLIT